MVGSLLAGRRPPNQPPDPNSGVGRLTAMPCDRYSITGIFTRSVDQPRIGPYRPCHKAHRASGTPTRPTGKVRVWNPPARKNRGDQGLQERRLPTVYRTNRGPSQSRASGSLTPRRTTKRLSRSRVELSWRPCVRLEGEAWSRYFRDFDRAFRLELRQVYTMPGEADELERFRAGETHPPPSYTTAGSIRWRRPSRPVRPCAGCASSPARSPTTPSMSSPGVRVQRQSR